MLLVEHDMAFVMGIADRVTVLDFGRRIADGTPAEVQQRPRGRARLPGRRRVSQFVSLLVGGLFLGAIYALVALGFVTIFRATGVINFAQGSRAAARRVPRRRALHDSIGFWPAVLVGVAAAALVVAADRRGADPPRAAPPTSARSRSSRSASTSCSRPS